MSQSNTLPPDYSEFMNNLINYQSRITTPDQADQQLVELYNNLMGNGQTTNSPVVAADKFNEQLDHLTYLQKTGDAVYPQAQHLVNALQAEFDGYEHLTHPGENKNYNGGIFDAALAENVVNHDENIAGLQPYSAPQGASPTYPDGTRYDGVPSYSQNNFNFTDTHYLNISSPVKQLSTWDPSAAAQHIQFETLGFSAPDAWVQDPTYGPVEEGHPNTVSASDALDGNGHLKSGYVHTPYGYVQSGQEMAYSQPWGLTGDGDGTYTKSGVGPNTNGGNHAFNLEEGHIYQNYTVGQPWSEPYTPADKTPDKDHTFSYLPDPNYTLPVNAQVVDGDNTHVDISHGIPAGNQTLDNPAADRTGLPSTAESYDGTPYNAPNANEFLAGGQPQNTSGAANSNSDYNLYSYVPEGGRLVAYNQQNAPGTPKVDGTTIGIVTNNPQGGQANADTPYLHASDENDPNLNLNHIDHSGFKSFSNFDWEETRDISLGGFYDYNVPSTATWGDANAAAHRLYASTNDWQGSSFVWVWGTDNQWTMNNALRGKDGLTGDNYPTPSADPNATEAQGAPQSNVIQPDAPGGNGVPEHMDFKLYNDTENGLIDWDERLGNDLYWPNANPDDPRNSGFDNSPGGTRMSAVGTSPEGTYLPAAYQGTANSNSGLPSGTVFTSYLPSSFSGQVAWPFANGNQNEAAQPYGQGGNGGPAVAAFHNSLPQLEGQGRLEPGELSVLSMLSPTDKMSNDISGTVGAGDSDDDNTDFTGQTKAVQKIESDIQSISNNPESGLANAGDTYEFHTVGKDSRKNGKTFQQGDGSYITNAEEAQTASLNLEDSYLFWKSKMQGFSLADYIDARSTFLEGIEELPQQLQGKLINDLKTLDSIEDPAMRDKAILSRYVHQYQLANPDQLSRFSGELSAYEKQLKNDINTENYSEARDLFKRIDSLNFNFDTNGKWDGWAIPDPQHSSIIENIGEADQQYQLEKQIDAISGSDVALTPHEISVVEQENNYTSQEKEAFENKQHQMYEALTPDQKKVIKEDEFLDNIDGLKQQFLGATNTSRIGDEYQNPYRNMSQSDFIQGQPKVSLREAIAAEETLYRGYGYYHPTQDRSAAITGGATATGNNPDYPGISATVDTDEVRQEFHFSSDITSDYSAEPMDQNGAKGANVPGGSIYYQEAEDSINIGDQKSDPNRFFHIVDPNSVQVGGKGGATYNSNYTEALKVARQAPLYMALNDLPIQGEAHIVALKSAVDNADPTPYTPQLNDAMYDYEERSLETNVPAYEASKEELQKAINAYCAQPNVTPNDRTVLQTNFNNSVMWNDRVNHTRATIETFLAQNDPTANYAYQGELYRDPATGVYRTVENADPVERHTQVLQGELRELQDRNLDTIDNDNRKMDTMLASENTANAHKADKTFTRLSTQANDDVHNADKLHQDEINLGNAANTNRAQAYSAEQDAAKAFDDAGRAKTDNNMYDHDQDIIDADNDIRAEDELNLDAAKDDYLDTIYSDGKTPGEIGSDTQAADDQAAHSDTQLASEHGKQAEQATARLNGETNHDTLVSDAHQDNVLAHLAEQDEKKAWEDAGKAAIDGHKYDANSDVAAAQSDENSASTLRNDAVAAYGKASANPSNALTDDTNAYEDAQNAKKDHTNATDAQSDYNAHKTDYSSLNHQVVNDEREAGMASEDAIKASQDAAQAKSDGNTIDYHEDEASAASEEDSAQKLQSIVDTIDNTLNKAGEKIPEGANSSDASNLNRDAGKASHDATDDPSGSHDASDDRQDHSDASQAASDAHNDSYRSHKQDADYAVANEIAAVGDTAGANAADRFLHSDQVDQGHVGTDQAKEDALRIQASDHFKKDDAFYVQAENDARNAFESYQQAHEDFSHGAETADAYALNTDRLAEQRISKDMFQEEQIVSKMEHSLIYQGGGRSSDLAHASNDAKKTGSDASHPDTPNSALSSDASHDRSDGSQAASDASSDSKQADKDADKSIANFDFATGNEANAAQSQHMLSGDYSDENNLYKNTTDNFDQRISTANAISGRAQTHLNADQSFMNQASNDGKQAWDDYEQAKHDHQTGAAYRDIVAYHEDQEDQKVIAQDEQDEHQLIDRLAQYKTVASNDIQDAAHAHHASDNALNVGIPSSDQGHPSDMPQKDINKATDVESDISSNIASDQQHLADAEKDEQTASHYTSMASSGSLDSDPDAKYALKHYGDGASAAEKKLVSDLSSDINKEEGNLSQYKQDVSTSQDRLNQEAARAREPNHIPPSPSGGGSPQDNANNFLAGLGLGGDSSGGGSFDFDSAFNVPNSPHHASHAADEGGVPGSNAAPVTPSHEGGAPHHGDSSQPHQNPEHGDDIDHNMGHHSHDSHGTSVGHQHDADVSTLSHEEQMHQQDAHELQGEHQTHEADVQALQNDQAVHAQDVQQYDASHDPSNGHTSQSTTAHGSSFNANASADVHDVHSGHQPHEGDVAGHQGHNGGSAHDSAAQNVSKGDNTQPHHQGGSHQHASHVGGRGSAHGAGGGHKAAKAAGTADKDSVHQQGNSQIQGLEKGVDDDLHQLGDHYAGRVHDVATAHHDHSQAVQQDENALEHMHGANAGNTFDDLLSAVGKDDPNGEQHFAQYQGEFHGIQNDVHALNQDPSNAEVVENLDTQKAELDQQVHHGDALCFTTGTLIKTTTGEKAVEALQVGDVAVTSSGEAKEIAWIGHQDVIFGAGSERPVTIKAHALADNVPYQDLTVSAAHGLALTAHVSTLLGRKSKRVLARASALVNDMSIVTSKAPRATYWHVELEGGHDVLIANGAAAESFADHGERNFFSSASSKEASSKGKDCLPRYKRGRYIRCLKTILNLRSVAISQKGNRKHSKLG